jgi:site-specific DNA-methyltransferase (adenine-specific)
MILDVLEGRAQWALVNGDACEVLAQIPRVDHVITDPPYSPHVHGKQRRMLRGAGGASVGDAPLGFDALTDNTRSTMALEFARLCARWCLVFSDAESVYLWLRDLTCAGLRHVRTGAWVKVNGQPQLSGDRPAVGFEAIEIAHGAQKCAWNNGGHPAVWQVAIATDRNGRGDRVHTTQKPIGLMLRLVEQFTNPGDVVLDPFAGSGTTGIACLALGRRFIGVERDQAYAEIARKRLAAEGRGLTLADASSGQCSIYDVIASIDEEPEEVESEPPTTRGIPLEKRKRIRELRAEGLPLGIVSERLGVHVNTALKYSRRSTLKRCATCQRKLRGKEMRCYLCRGMRASAARTVRQALSRGEPLANVASKYRLRPSVVRELAAQFQAEKGALEAPRD